MSDEELINAFETVSISEKPPPPENYTGIIYKATCKTTSMSYIGQTRSHKLKNDGKYINYGIKGRWSHHLSDARSKLNKCSDILLAIRKYGNNDWDIVILLECKIEELNEKETFYIRELNTLSPNGYNMVDGGSGPHSMSETLREKISAIGKKYYSQEGAKEALSQNRISFHDKVKIEKVQAHIEKINHCKMLIRSSGVITLYFYDNINSKNSIAINGSTSRMVYDSKHATTDESLTRIINLFNSLTKKITIEFKDENLKQQYESIKRDLQIAGSSSNQSTD